MNYHKILGITNNACKKTIREAYLKKVKLYHPDINKNPDAITKFKQIQEAYQALYNNDYSNKSYYDGNGYKRGYRTEDIKKNPYYSYTDDYSDFNKTFYEEVHKMREKERSEQNRKYANSSDNYSFNDILHRYPREYFYINLMFKLFPLFIVPILFIFIIYKQYILKSHFMEKPVIIYDSYGRAYLVNVHGKKFRASEFDKY